MNVVGVRLLGARASRGRPYGLHQTNENGVVCGVLVGLEGRR